ncbi:hypothetical protein DOTSEDRAFT_56007 [Dothistroma septosporum NZE10]|uniref:tRNA(Ile)-lysidine synthetase n=1 Tax=Dothistroma septosporum (strain NZE10 / CBS 128990) TaxID=675120 RepID=N1PHY7_DOTSN|nr:hypothetical protein DOTSEDRAFT_56007 [Dothistroma septosporum NZE10]
MPNPNSEQALQTILREVKHAIRGLFPTNIKPQRLGLAISGGVDSMALATLTKIIKEDSTFPHTFTGFIVDHRLREDSSEEAILVAKSLKQLDIEPMILNLDWNGHGDPRELNNFESVARTLRYQALGIACAAKKIPHLIFGHHADDQAETVISRAIDGYTGLGLRGISSHAPIPECQGIHGVDHSGSPRVSDGLERLQVPLQPKARMNYSLGGPKIAVEQGGVSIHRPLLDYTKQQLKLICHSYGTPWHEDVTNLDRTLTIRNSVRHLQEGSLLPTALLRPRAVETAEKVRRRKSRIEDDAQKMFEMTPIDLDLSSGKAVATISKVCQERDDAPYDYHIKAAFVRKLLLLVSPGAYVSLQDLDQCIDLVFASSEMLDDSSPRDSHMTQVSGVLVIRAGTARNALHRSITLQRQPPARAEREGAVKIRFVNPRGSWSQWLLWDHRYWIRVYEDVVARNGNTTMHVGHLTPGSLGALRKRLKNDGHSMLGLKQALSLVPEKVRWTVPAIVARSEREDRVVGLPTLRWVDKCWELGEFPLHSRRWEIRYKNIDFPNKDCHKLIQ